MDKILEAEQQFQDSKITDNVRSGYDAFYEDNTDILKHVDALLSTCSGTILIYGCGDVDITSFAHKGFSKVVGIDISPKSIEKIQAVIHEKRLENKVTCVVMDAHAMTFEDGSFDVVFGTGILHHLDVEKAMQQIKRVLKSGGKMIFMEPLGINPLVNWYRNRTPEARTEFEHPFRLTDIKIIKRYFTVRSKGFYIFTVLSFGFKVFIKSDVLYKVSRYFFLRVDAALLFLFPFLKYLCWIMVIEGTKK